jgi:hypothetical protein
MTPYKSYQTHCTLTSCLPVLASWQPIGEEILVVPRYLAIPNGSPYHATVSRSQLLDNQQARKYWLSLLTWPYQMSCPIRRACDAGAFLAWPHCLLPPPRLTAAHCWSSPSTTANSNINFGTLICCPVLEKLSLLVLF